MNNLMTDPTSRSNLQRIGALVAIACLVATAVWLGARGRTGDDVAGSDNTTSDLTSSTQPSGVEQTAPETAPIGGVVIPGGADQADGYPTGFPQTDLGAVALQIEVAKAQVGFDYDQAVTVAGLYADPADKAVFEERARDAVALRRQQAGVGKDGDVPAPASYAVTPIAYTLEELGTDYYAVNLLSYLTLTTADGEVKDGLYAGTQLMRWLRGRWCLGLATGPGQHRGHPAPGRGRPAAGGRPQHACVQAGRLGADQRSPPVTAGTSSERGLVRLGVGALTVLLLTTLLGAATTLQPPAAGLRLSAAARSPATDGQLPARTLKMGCPGPDALCDLGGDALDCAGDPVDCAKDAAGEVKDGAEPALDGLGGLAEDLPGPGDLIPDGVIPGGLPGCGLLDAVCDGLGGRPARRPRYCGRSGAREPRRSLRWRDPRPGRHPEPVRGPRRRRRPGRWRRLDRGHAGDLE